MPREAIRAGLSCDPSFQAVKAFSIIPECFFRDEAEPDPAKRWKAYGFMSLNLRRRGGAYLYSADGLTWHVHPEVPVLDPSVRGTPAVVGGPESQIHDTVVFPYGGYYVALYQNQYDGRRLDIELAVSRDAETFVHVKPGEKIIPLGAPGSWDADYIIQTNPILFEDSIWVYYGGGHYFEVPAQEKARYPLVDLKFQPGLATLRRDGFTSVALAEGQSAAGGEGSLTTIPFRVAQASCPMSLTLLQECRLQPAERPRDGQPEGCTPECQFHWESGLLSLVVNAACDRERTLTVELLEAATGQPIPGYSRADCDPLTSDAVRQAVTWRGQAGLPRLEGKRLRLRFHFHGDASMPRLYSFGFAGYAVKGDMQG
ncbi:MAG: hypothetical protein FJ279_05380 [Planctomycetes bacterium]|nr:hypothetical protein [Planctomycetota bacterium]